MKIEDMIAILEAAKRGEKIEHLPKGYPNTVWQPKDHEGINTFMYDYRIAPKKEMTLVEEARCYDKAGFTNTFIHKLADRIEELEKVTHRTWRFVDTDELLAELKRRTSC
jgi:hypothetical protein